MKPIQLDVDLLSVDALDAYEQDEDGLGRSLRDYIEEYILNEPDIVCLIDAIEREARLLIEEEAQDEYCDVR